MSVWQKNTAASLRDMLVTLGQRQVPNARDGFDDEFDALCGVDDRVKSNPDEYYSGSLASNMSKNRYRDVLPNEGTRVVLEPVTARGDGDYINANYVDARRLFGVPFVYIAAQAPTKGSIGDFWRMVWENNSAFIVMLCAEVESGKNKSARYFPDREGGMIYCGAVSVVLETENRRQDTVFRSCLVRNENGQERRVFHMQHIRWPDQGIPHSSHGLIEMIAALGKSPLSTQTPIVVHCSGGIGRTGVFIALHVALALFQLERPISVPRIVQYLKYCRTGMVQRKDQYLFLYYAVLREMEKMIWAHENQPRALTAGHTQQQLAASSTYVERRAVEHAPQFSAQQRPLVETSSVFGGGGFGVGAPHHGGGEHQHQSIEMTDHHIVSGDAAREQRQREELEAVVERRVAQNQRPVVDHGLGYRSSSSSRGHHPHQHAGGSPGRQHSASTRRDRDPYAAAGPRTSVEEQLAALQAKNARKRASAQPYPSASRGMHPGVSSRPPPPVIHTPIANRGHSNPPHTAVAEAFGGVAGLNANSNTQRSASYHQQPSLDDNNNNNHHTSLRRNSVEPHNINNNGGYRAAVTDPMPEASPSPHSPELIMRGPIAQRVEQHRHPVEEPRQQPPPQPQSISPAPQASGGDGTMPRSSLGRMQQDDDVHSRLADQRGAGAQAPTRFAAAADQQGRRSEGGTAPPPPNSKPASRQKYFFEAEDGSSAAAATTSSGVKKSDYSLL